MRTTKVSDITNGEYMKQKLQAFDITEAQLLDSGVDLDAEYQPNSRIVALGMISVIEDLVLAPQRTNISENGFSVSWDTSHLAQYYRYLCKKWGVTPNADVLEELKIPTIKDVSEMW